MRILQINAAGHASSTGRTCHEFQQYVNEKTEHECCTAFAQGQTDRFNIQIGNLLEWKFHGLFSQLTGKQAHFSRFGTLSLLRFMDQYQPEVVILRNLHGNYIHFPMLMHYLAENNIATVAVLHDCWFFTGKCTHYTVSKCYRWKTGCHDCPRLRRDNVSLLFDATRELWNEKKTLFESIPRLAVVGVSDWITNEAKQSFLSCAQKIQRIYNWIDVETFSPREDVDYLKNMYHLNEKNVILGVASRWNSAKGLDSFREISKRIGDNNQIVLIGKIQESISLPENVLAVPPTNSVQELAQWYSLAKVFVSMSLEESFGKVSAEALACGTPVVCFDSTANKELVGNGCGFCLASDDIDSLLESIKTICNGDSSIYRNACRSFALSNFSSEDRIKDYIMLAESLLG